MRRMLQISYYNCPMVLYAEEDVQVLDVCQEVQVVSKVWNVSSDGQRCLNVAA
jgi:hypothetical protein